jgi:hypothetical protein
LPDVSGLLPEIACLCLTISCILPEMIDNVPRGTQND